MWSAVKVRNRVIEAADGYDLSLRIIVKNIRVNGELKGSSGFVTDRNTGVCIYLTTDVGSYSTLKGKAMYRLAKNETDYSSNHVKNGYNRWTPLESLGRDVVKLLLEENKKRQEGEHATVSCGA